MLDENEELVENEEALADEEIPVSEIDISDITFNGKDLFSWEQELTIKFPSLPCPAATMTQCLIDLSNKYQVAYNAYNELLVLASRAESQYKSEKYRLCAEYIQSCKTLKAKIPAMATVEAMVINNVKNKKLSSLLEIYKIYEIIKDFFCNNKTKLEKTITLAKDISYSVNSSDKIYQNSQYGNGMSVT